MPQDAASALVYRNYTQEELDWQYDHSKRFPDTSVFNAERAAMSARAREHVACRLNVPYGEGENEVLDIFPAEGGGKSPIIVFIHGGAWTRGSKDSYSFPAETFVPRGVAWVATEFTNIPPNTMDGMVRQNREAIAWVYRNADSFGGDPDRIHVAGHSSGGHLTGMMLITDWEKEFGLPRDLLKGVTAISGMYDLEPIILSYRNRYVKLDEGAVQRNSAIRNIPTGYGPPLIIGCGEFDTAEFHRQPEAFLAAWQAAGHHGEFIEIKGAHHFAASYAYNNPDGPLVPKILAQIGI